MSTVFGVKKCCKCGGIAEYSFRVPSTEEVRHCTACGLTQQWELRRNADGSVFTSDAMPYGEMLYHESGGYGAASVMYWDGNSGVYPLSKASFKEAKAILKEWKRNPLVELRDCCVTVFDAKRGKVRTIFGSKPMTYEEYERQIPCNEDELGVSVTEITANDVPDENSDLPF